MRKKIVAGNWKMNKSLDESTALVKETLQLMQSEKAPAGLVIFCPPFISLASVSSLTQGKENVFTAAQNCHAEKAGAYTGEISAGMIKSTGAAYVILGHSERRQYFHETDEELARKTDRVLSEELKPIFCVGELLDARESGRQNVVVETQLRNGLFHLTAEQFSQVVIAYEPVWAIGTGKVASDEQAQEIHAFIRTLIAQRYDRGTADNTTILYGGSCKPSNAKGLFSQPDVDGGLIGGASLAAADFVGIIKAM